MLRLTALFIVIAAVLSVVIELKSPQPSVESEDNNVPSFTPFKRKISKRTPASIDDSRVNSGRSAGVRRVEGNIVRDRSAELPDLSETETESPSSGFYGQGGGMGYSSDSGRANRSPGSSSSSKQSTGSSGNNANSSSRGGGAGGAMVFGNVGFPKVPTKTPTPTAPIPTNDSPSSSSGTSSTLSCKGSYGGGAYSHPIGVQLSCSSSAEISYCLSQDGCCDPELEGGTYSSAVIVGAKEGNFCLSFSGEANGKISGVTQINYTIDNTYPHLHVTHPKVVYQTTQLAGSSIITSNDFSKSGFHMGQVNLKTHNPNPDGLDLDCDKIMEQYSEFSNPLTSMILSLDNMMGLSPTSEVEVPLNLTEMIYGENYITTFVVNQNYGAPLYSCSTTKVTLSDFNLFQMESAHWSVGATGMQEFSGSFMAVGAFEDGAESFRAPASVDNEADLNTGLFEVVY